MRATGRTWNPAAAAAHTWICRGHRARWAGACWIAFTALIRRGARTPYFHLVNADGTPYMDRFWLPRIGRAGVDDRGQPRPWLALRLHHIRSSDHGGVFHDHPWSFFSLILRGGYFEHRAFDGPLPAAPVSDAPHLRLPGAQRR